VACIYPILGFGAAPEDREAAGKTATANLQEFADNFLQEKFIGGDKPSIADYKIAPFIFAFSHPALKKESFVEIPTRFLAFNRDFAAEVKAASILTGEGGSKSVLDKALEGEMPTTETADYKKEDLCAAKKPAGRGKVKIYGSPPSANSMTTLLFAEEAGVGTMELTFPGEQTNTPEYLKINPYHATPALLDGEFNLGESTAILRYMAQMYAPDFYPAADSKKRAFIDWAMDCFSNTVYGPFTKVVYPVLGFAPEPENPQEEAKKAVAEMEAWAAHFLKEKFIGGEKLSIGDFKVAPFFFALGHALVKEKTGLELPERIAKFNADFAATAKSAKLLENNQGKSIKEMLDEAGKPQQTEEAIAIKDAMVEEDVAVPVVLEPVIEDRPAPVCGCFGA